MVNRAAAGQRHLYVAASIITASYCPLSTPAVAGQQLHASVSTGSTLDTVYRLEATATLL